MSVLYTLHMLNLQTEVVRIGITGDLYAIIGPLFMKILKKSQFFRVVFDEL